MLGSDDSRVDDVLQETFIAAYRSAATYRGKAAVRTWLFTIARNKLYRSGRKRSESVLARNESLESLGRRAGWGTDPGPEEAVVTAERRAKLHAALARLPATHREVLVARDLSGMTGPETAELLGISLPAMKARLNRARLNLLAEVRSEAHHDDV